MNKKQTKKEDKPLDEKKLAEMNNLIKDLMKKDEGFGDDTDIEINLYLFDLRNQDGEVKPERDKDAHIFNDELMKLMKKYRVGRVEAVILKKF